MHPRDASELLREYATLIADHKAQAERIKALEGERDEWAAIADQYRLASIGFEVERDQARAALAALQDAVRLGEALFRYERWPQLSPEHRNWKVADQSKWVAQAEAILAALAGPTADHDAGLGETP
jgi:hypothetical protein